MHLPGGAAAGPRPKELDPAVYATNSGGDVLNVIDPATLKSVSTIDIEGAHGVAFSPDGSKVYVSNEATSTLDVFDQQTGKLLKKVIAGSGHPNNIRGRQGRGRIVVGDRPRSRRRFFEIIDSNTLTSKVRTSRPNQAVCTTPM